MDTKKSRCRWWARKRTRAALALWLLFGPPLVYVLSIGPALYAVKHRWINLRTYAAISWPFVTRVKSYDTADLALSAYCDWWVAVGEPRTGSKHAEARGAAARHGPEDAVAPGRE